MEQVPDIIKLVIAEDQALIKQALVELIIKKPDFEVVATARDGNELLEVLGEARPEVILMDIKSSKPNSLEITRILDEKMPWIKVVSLSNNNHPFFIKEMLKHGAKGFLSKNCSVEELYDGIRNVSNGKTFFCSRCSNVLLRDIVHQPEEGKADFRTITTREIEIVGYLAEGFTTSEIASKLFISSKTVERHKSNLLKKMNLRNTAHMIKVASENGLLFY